MFRVDPSRCRGCGACASVCPAGAIEFVGGKARINPSLCVGCGACARICPAGAIQPAFQPPPTQPVEEIKSRLISLSSRIRELRGRVERVAERLKKEGAR